MEVPRGGPGGVPKFRDQLHTYVSRVVRMIISRTYIHAHT